jgi:hypothetical protein
MRKSAAVGDFNPDSSQIVSISYQKSEKVNSDAFMKMMVPALIKDVYDISLFT